MQSYFDDINGGEAVLGDLGMIINDPYATHTLLRNIFSLLSQAILHEELPMNMPNLCYISQLLSLGLSAGEMIEHQKFTVPNGDKEVVRLFYPMLLAKMVDDMLREEDEEPELNPALLKLFENNLLARKVTLFYVLKRVEEKDVEVVKQFLEHVSDHMVTEEPAFIQSLVTLLINNKNVGIKTVVENFLWSKLEVSVVVHKQLIRYLMETHTKLTTRELQAALEKTTSTKYHEKLQGAYELFLHRVSPRINQNNAGFLYEYLGLVSSEEEGKSDSDEAPPASYSSPYSP
eukprot:CAMPEP_0174254276 /NCGR_PEP_ID=MMETSP0439-20130205/3609_1 /TAXON_ID=0 /ORGANISM="Stereomyxa ramosa, Strain Chinc5" /LENGTH=288 /DNA_ID=CAMNT_0015335767 /DNA_START=1046 /DNA_END=1912 /DNA_ORIENTATION=-